MKSQMFICFYLISSTSICRADLVINGSFESGASVMGPRPTTYGNWQGDKSSYVPSTLGITPYHGEKMLQFVNAQYIPSESNGAQYWQNIDLSSYSSMISNGTAAINASAFFNRVSGDSQTDTEFSLVIRARSGTPSSFSELDIRSSTIYSDSNTSTWEMASINDFILPTNTSFLQVEIYALENIYNDFSDPEYDGHFADMVSVNIVAVPEFSPTTGLALVALALLLLKLQSLKQSKSTLAIASATDNPQK